MTKRRKRRQATNGRSAPPDDALVQHGRRLIAALAEQNEPDNEAVQALASIMAATHVVLSDPAYSASAKGGMIGRALRAVFNYGLQRAGKDETGK